MSLLASTIALSVGRCRGGGLIFWLAGSLSLLVVGCGPSEEMGAHSVTEASPNRGMAEAALGDSRSLGEGFVVWESNRSGPWRIWTRRLDGSELRQLTPDEPGLHHCCPHISPDGRWVAYLSVGERRDYRPEGVAGPLHLMKIASGEDRVIAEMARSYFEHRAVVWRTATNLVFIGEDGSTWELDLESGERRQLIAEPPKKGGWLPNSTLTHATSGVPTFSPFDPTGQVVAERTRLGGCEPYFSFDGRWGYWVAGAGGPINRIDLTTREITKIVDKNDPLMPDDWGYAYFPMFSANRLLFAYAASQGEHSHHESDYEVFVAESNPDTLELVDRPVRLTWHPGTDRYPDVFLEPLPLGRYSGEVPLTVRLDPGDGKWQWDFGDGSRSEGPAGEHTYRQPGRFKVQAGQEAQKLVGMVVALEAQPPRPLEVELKRNGEEMVIHFDEEIGTEKAELAFESGRQIVGWRVDRDARSLQVELAERFEGIDRLTLGGISDLAQVPNLLPPTTVDVVPPLWPSRRQGLVFLWETGDAANLVFDEQLGADRAISLRASEMAHLNGHFAMQLSAGSFFLSQKEAETVRKAIMDSNELSIEAVVRPQEEAASGVPGKIIAFSSRGGGHNFRLLQRGNTLIFGLRTSHPLSPPKTGLALFEVPTGRSSHVVVTYTPGRLVAYLDGEKQVDTDRLQGDFFHWRPSPLVFGAEWGGGGDWPGVLEGVAVYNRVLGSQEVEENALRYRAQLERRQEVPRVVADARLRNRSKMPTLAEISPYREALVVYEYDVERTVQGQLATDRIRVAHWSILDGDTLPIAQAREGQILRLVLESFSANPQLESLYLSDTFEDGRELPLYYAVDLSLGG